MRHMLKGAVSAAALMLAPVAIAQTPQSESQAQDQTATEPAPEVTIEQDITVTTPEGQTETQERTVQPQTQTQQQTAQEQPSSAAQTASADCAEMTIYFDYNADAVLQDKEAEVAKKAESCKAEQIRVVGYTDESGDAAYNKMLGERRAEAVKSMLVAMGVPAADIMVESKGEEEATGDASKDRKVEVEFETASMEDESEDNAG